MNFLTKKAEFLGLQLIFSLGGKGRGNDGGLEKKRNGLGKGMKLVHIDFFLRGGGGVRIVFMLQKNEVIKI